MKHEGASRIARGYRVEHVKLLADTFSLLQFVHGTFKSLSAEEKVEQVCQILPP